VIYVLHDITRPETYGGLPANPQIPPTFTVWKRFAKPVALALSLFAAPVAFFHYVTQGAKEPQPPSPGYGESGPTPGFGESRPPSSGYGGPRPEPPRSEVSR
jgi:hypothetical protein